MFDGLRAELGALGLTPFDISLPGEDMPVEPLQGALRVRRDVGDFLFVLETVDYGTGYRLLDAPTEMEARDMVLAYVSRPLPPVRPLPRAELDAIVGRIAKHYLDLRDRAQAAGTRGIVIDLPPGIPIDRIGALDGVHTYPIGTLFELRSLPPSTLRPENDVHKFLTTTDIRVGVTITAPWFGRTGGGIRFTLQQPGLGLRDLVAYGALERLMIV
ncbi:MAG TPA: TNT domain-containing protein [Actinomycetes bacterium]|nr:TNT domain-containing protein [Actinomycetes bacterium]